MRDVHIAHLDQARPVLVLTRDLAREHMRNVTIAPITSTIKGLSTEVAVGRRNGLDHECVISCDNLTTIEKSRLGRQIGHFFDDQETELATAISNAFGLRVT